MQKLHAHAKEMQANRASGPYMRGLFDKVRFSPYFTSVLLLSATMFRLHQDPERFSKFSMKFNDSILFDYSKNLVTDETMKVKPFCDSL